MSVHGTAGVIGLCVLAPCAAAQFAFAEDHTPAPQPPLARPVRR